MPRNILGQGYVQGRGAERRWHDGYRGNYTDDGFENTLLFVVVKLWHENEFFFKNLVIQCHRAFLVLFRQSCRKLPRSLAGSRQGQKLISISWSTSNGIIRGSNWLTAIFFFCHHSTSLVVSGATDFLCYQNKDSYAWNTVGMQPPPCLVEGLGHGREVLGIQLCWP